jgi:hypothetical protein
MTAEHLSLVFTGHMVDLPGRSPPRFPPELVDAARAEIERRVTRIRKAAAKNSIKGFASLARGGDILFHEICRSFGFGTVVVLTFSPDHFLKTSVEGAEGGGWPQRFQKNCGTRRRAPTATISVFPNPMTPMLFATSVSWNSPGKKAPCSSLLFGR